MTNLNTLPQKPRGLLSRWFGGEERRASVPPGMRVYAIGDIHGRADLLDLLTVRILDDSAAWRREGHAAKIVYLGDYVDRGPDSKTVIDRLLAPPPELDAVFLLGNHDKVLLDFLEDPSLFGAWREFGARETLLSYGVVPPLFENQEAFVRACDAFRAALPDAHLRFFRTLQLSAEIGGYVFVHAGVRPGVDLGRQSAEDMLWIRGDFLDSSADFGAVIIHGHTPTEQPVVRPNRIGVDTGACMTGQLTAVVLEGSGYRFLST